MELDPTADAVVLADLVRKGEVKPLEKSLDVEVDRVGTRLIASAQDRRLPAQEQRSPLPLEIIEKEIRELEQEIQGMLGEVLG